MESHCLKTFTGFLVFNIFLKAQLIKLAESIKFLVSLNFFSPFLKKTVIEAEGIITTCF